MMVSDHFRLTQNLTTIVPVKKKINIACAVPACNKRGLVENNTAQREWNFTDKSSFLDDKNTVAICDGNPN